MILSTKSTVGMVGTTRCKGRFCREFCTVILGVLSSAYLANAKITVLSEVTNATLATIDDQPFRFIPDRFSFYEIQGYLRYSDPPSACTPPKPPPSYLPNIDFPINWILIAKRSPDCHFQRKIENAQNAGYTAIIIHNVGSNSTERMGVDDPSKIIIYATFVGEYDGEILKNHTFGTQSFVKIQDDFTFNGPYLLPFAIVVGVCFTIMIVFMVRLLWQQVVRWIRERRRSRRRKLPASALKKLPTQKWSKGDPYETCAVCLEDFVEQDKIRVLPCSHGFHMKCIDPWLTKGRRVCPICKRKVVVADEVVKDSDLDTDDETAPLLGSSVQVALEGEGTFVQTEAEVARSANEARTHTFGHCNNAVIDSDSSSLLSDSSYNSSSQPGSSNQSHSVLAEVHHSSEVLRERIRSIEATKTSENDPSKVRNCQNANCLNLEESGGQTSSNALFVPCVQFEDDKSWGTESSSPDVVSNRTNSNGIENTSSNNPIV